MIIDYDPRFKLIKLLVKEQFELEGIPVPDRILPPTTLPTSNPRELFLVRVCSLLLSELESLVKEGNHNTKEYKHLDYLYNKFRKERYEVC